MALLTLHDTKVLHDLAGHGAPLRSPPPLPAHRYSPSLETAFRIAHVFKVPLEDVFHYPDTSEENR